MVKKAALIIASVIIFGIIFILSFKITEKTVKNKNEAENSSDASVSESVGDASSPATGENTDEQSTEADRENDTDTPEAPAEDTVLPEPTIINMPTDSTWCTVLLNKYYKMNDSYEPKVEVVLEDSGVYLEERVAEKFREMYAAAMADGITLTPAAGYVSLERQERKFEKQVELYVASGMSEEEAKAKTAYTVLPVGCSESNYGLAVDIGWLSADFSDSPAYEWLKSNGADYGFVERYTADKTEYTHFNAEPWHWRYVGTEAAKAMVADGLCLEEYLGKIN